MLLPFSIIIYTCSPKNLAFLKTASYYLSGKSAMQIDVSNYGGLIIRALITNIIYDLKR